MRFEWDERKRLSNLEKHGLDFLDVDVVFEAPHVEVPSTYRDEEQRFLAIGTFEGRYVTVVCTTRREAVRVISFRGARHEERQKYQELYGGGA
ncbi:MAG: BrnT family toxin [Syntrophobacteraceae bacterium]